jgi:hypothetical protein
MAATIPTTTTDLLRAQLAALESMYATERRCSNARRILDLIHQKRDELSVALLAIDRADLDQARAA